MARFFLYLDEHTAERVKIAAKQTGLSQRRLLTRLIHEKTTTAWRRSRTWRARMIPSPRSAFGAALAETRSGDGPSVESWR
jgi:hypothetical protein